MRLFPGIKNVKIKLGGWKRENGGLILDMSVAGRLGCCNRTSSATGQIRYGAHLIGGKFPLTTGCSLNSIPTVNKLINKQTS